MLKQLLELLKCVGLAVIGAFLIITFVFEVVSVQGHSMDPTLNDKDRLIVEKVSYYFRKPNKGDIVVIKYPADTREKFIKRVIAVGGETVSIHDNKVYINGKATKETYIAEEYMDDFPEVKVPKNTIFVLGDNRNHSRDSRFEDVGFVNLKLVVGRAAFRIYPFNIFGSLYKDKK